MTSDFDATLEQGYAKATASKASAILSAPSLDAHTNAIVCHFGPEPGHQRDHLLNVRVDDISPEQLIDLICHAVATRSRMAIVNANAHLINLAQRRPWLRELFDGAHVAFCDGAGVQFALWLQTGRRPRRHTPPQWIEPLAHRVARNGGTVYWLGGRPEIVKDAAEQMERRTGLRAAGYHHGYFDPAPNSPGNEAVLADIRATRPDILLITMGMPLQERWLYDNWARLDVPVALTAGALVDHVAGHVKRPPAWVAALGLEWLVRLAAEPSRLWRRYLFGLPIFGFRLFIAYGRAQLQPGRMRRPITDRPWNSATRWE